MNHKKNYHFRKEIMNRWHGFGWVAQAPEHGQTNTGTQYCNFAIGVHETRRKKNENQKSKDYIHIKDAFRPSHADFSYQEKYGIRDYRGGGRSSARETANWVVAGAVAQQFLDKVGVKVTAYVSAVGRIKLNKLFILPSLFVCIA